MTASLLFRRETSRRLRAVAAEVAEAYRRFRYPWLNAFHAPDSGGVRRALEELARAVEDDDTARYCAYAEAQAEMYMAAGVPPVAVLNGGELLGRILLTYLTPDQRAIVEPVLAARRAHLDHISHLWTVQAPGA